MAKFAEPLAQLANLIIAKKQSFPKRLTVLLLKVNSVEFDVLLDSQTELGEKQTGYSKKISNAFKKSTALT